MSHWHTLSASAMLGKAGHYNIRNPLCRSSFSTIHSRYCSSYVLLKTLKWFSVHFFLFIVSSIHCFLSLIQRLQKTEFRWSSDWKLVFTGTVWSSKFNYNFSIDPNLGIHSLTLFVLKTGLLHLSSNSFIEKLFSVPTIKEIQTFPVLDENDIKTFILLNPITIYYHSSSNIIIFRIFPKLWIKYHWCSEVKFPLVSGLY